MVTNREEYVWTRCNLLGVQLRRHEESCAMRVAGLYHRLAGNPLFSVTTYVTLNPAIFIPDGVEKADWRIIDHELVHWERQDAAGVVRWVAKYLTSWRFRYHEERIAFLRDIKNGVRDVDRVIELLRGPLYGVHTPAHEIRAWYEDQLAVRVPRRPSDGV